MARPPSTLRCRRYAKGKKTARLFCRRCGEAGEQPALPASRKKSVSFSLSSRRGRRAACAAWVAKKKKKWRVFFAVVSARPPRSLRRPRCRKKKGAPFSMPSEVSGEDSCSPSLLLPSDTWRVLSPGSSRHRLLHRAEVVRQGCERYSTVLVVLPLIWRGSSKRTIGHGDCRSSGQHTSCRRKASHRGCAGRSI